jgi:hypothetical protein
MKLRILLVSTATAAAISLAALALPAQAPAKKAPAKGAKTAAPVVQHNDDAYTKKILEYTTEKYFLTELIDHLPASDTVPTPDKTIGHIVGAPDHLTYSKDIYAYMDSLAKASPRVKVFRMGKSEEGRDMLCVAVSDEENIKNLDHYKEINAKLADPRKTTPAEAEKLIAEAKPMYWASGSIHSPETGSPEMLMELAYRLAVEESPFIQSIRKNDIILITPLVEADGHDREVDTYNYRKGNPTKPASPLLYWGKYVAHDNNRDGMGMGLALTRNMMKNFFEFHPTVLHDLHESVPFLYTSTGTGPYNAWLDPIVVDEWQILAYNEIEEMTKRGVPGVWTHGYYDGWAPNYMFYIANGHNAIGRFYETFGQGGADTGVRTVPAGQAQRTWYRPNPPLPRVNWSLRNNVNMQESAILFAMHYVGDNKERFVRNFWLKSQRSVAKPTNEGPAAYVVDASRSPANAADLINLLHMQGVESHKLDKDITVKGEKFAAGSYVVRMDQPYSRMADMLLDTQYYNAGDERPYDDTGWTLGALRNIKTTRVTDTAILKEAMTLIPGEAHSSGGITGSATAAYLLNHNTDMALATLRYRLKDVKILAAEDGFEQDGAKYNAGTFIIPSEGNPSDTKSRLQAATAELGLTAVSTGSVPKVATHPTSAPRVLVVHTWQNTQSEGWWRMGLDFNKIPYTYKSVHELRDVASLKDKYDVIIIGQLNGTPQSIVRGVAGNEPIPYKKSELTPYLGDAPDTSDDIRGGIELDGIVHLNKFVHDGGLLVLSPGAAAIASTYGLIEGVSVQEPRQLNARGAVLNAQVADARSPIAYGYETNLAVYFNQSPILQANAGGFGGFGGGGGGGRGGAAGAPGGGGGGGIQGVPPGRPTGRGTDKDTDADIPQGRPVNMGPPADAAPAGGGRGGRGGRGGAAATPAGEDPLAGVPEELRAQLRASMPPADQMPRTVVRFVASEKDLLYSGLLTGGAELAGHPAVVDAPAGKGHVVLFANNPMWRNQTQGSYFLLFNAMLNWDHLGAGRRTPARPGAEASDDEILQWLDWDNWQQQ